MSELRLSPIERLVKALRRLPGIGEKTATRLAYFLLAAPRSVAEELGQAISRLHEEVGLCEEGCNLTEDLFRHLAPLVRAGTLHGIMLIAEKKASR